MIIRYSDVDTGNYSTTMTERHDAVDRILVGQCASGVSVTGIPPFAPVAQMVFISDECCVLWDLDAGFEGNVLDDRAHESLRHASLRISG